MALGDAKPCDTLCYHRLPSYPNAGSRPNRQALRSAAFAYLLAQPVFYPSSCLTLKLEITSHHNEILERICDEPLMMETFPLNIIQLIIE